VISSSSTSKADGRNMYSTVVVVFHHLASIATTHLPCAQNADLGFGGGETSIYMTDSIDVTSPD
jgi:hypothetical protein